jgi:hypothetical protein
MTHQGLPVKGYRAQSGAAVDRVNEMKVAEERLLTVLDGWKEDPEIDPRWLAIGRTQLEQAFMALNRSVFRPERVQLRGDEA